MKRTRIAVIGAGHWGRNHIRTVSSMTEAQLGAICEIEADKRRQLEKEYPSVPVTDSVEEALSQADAAIIATPASSHASLATTVIDLGVPVLVEKPLALSVAEAESVAQLADRKGVPVLVGHLLIFHPAVERLKVIIDSGDLGRIYYLYSQRVNLGQVRPDENALWSFGPHDVSVALHLLGELPNRVAAYGRSYLQPGIEDVVFLTMEFESGAMFHVQLSWLDPHKERRLTVVGEKKMIVWDDMQPREKLKVYDKGVDRPPAYRSYGESLSIREGDIFLPRVPNLEPLVLQLSHFVKVVNGAEPGPTSASAGVEVVRVLEAASKSLSLDGNRVTVGKGRTG